MNMSMLLIDKSIMEHKILYNFIFSLGSMVYPEFMQ